MRYLDAEVQMDRDSGILQKVRGIAGLALVGATIGLVVAPVGDLLWRIFLRTGDGMPLEPGFWRDAFTRIPAAARDWALLGGFTGSSFGVLLLATGETRRLEDLSLLKVGVLGALAGAPYLVVYSAVVGDLSWMAYPEAYAPVAFTTLLGASLTTGMVTLAKRACVNDLGVDQRLVPPTQHTQK